MVTLIKLVLSRNARLCKRPLITAGRQSIRANLRLRDLGLFRPTHMPTARAEE